MLKFFVINFDGLTHSGQSPGQRHSRSRLHWQRGQAMPFIALLIVALAGMVSLSVDVGYYRYIQRQQQSAADSAAIAGAAQIAYGSSSATAAAKADASSNGFTNGVNGVTVTVNTSYSDTYTGSNNAVKVTISGSYNRFFGSVLGSGGIAVSSSAVARLSANNNACIYQLDSTKTPDFSRMTFSGSGCAMFVNGLVPNMTSASINAVDIGYAGTAPSKTGAIFTSATPAPSLPALDPCTHIAGCNYLANNPPNMSSCPNLNDNNKFPTLSPGCYHDLNVNSSTTQFLPGVYTITGLMNGNGSSNLTGTGVTFYVASGGSLAGLNSAGSVSWSAPSTGNTAGVLFYQVPVNTVDPNFSANSRFSGLLYFPTVDGNVQSVFNAYSVLVFGNLHFHGVNRTFASPPPNGSLIQEAAVAE